MSYHFFFHDDHINICGGKWSKRCTDQIFLKTEITKASALGSAKVFVLRRSFKCPSALYRCCALSTHCYYCHHAGTLGGGGWDDISEDATYPREAEWLLKKCTRLILELLSCSPWVVKKKVSGFSLHYLGKCSEGTIFSQLRENQNAISTNGNMTHHSF